MLRIIYILLLYILFLHIVILIKYYYWTCDKVSLLHNYIVSFVVVYICLVLKFFFNSRLKEDGGRQFSHLFWVCLPHYLSFNLNWYCKVFFFTQDNGGMLFTKFSSSCSLWLAILWCHEGNLSLLTMWDWCIVGAGRNRAWWNVNCNRRW